MYPARRLSRCDLPRRGVRRGGGARRGAPGRGGLIPPVRRQDRPISIVTCCDCSCTQRGGYPAVTCLAVGSAAARSRRREGLVALSGRTATRIVRPVLS